MSTRILRYILIFFLGALGGIWAQAFLLPYFAFNSPFQNWQFVQEWNERTTIIREVQELVINRDEAIELAIAKTEKSVVGIKSIGAGIILEGSGFVATSDGFVLTLASLVPQGYNVMVFIPGEDEPTPAQILKRDATIDLVLLKIERNGLQTTSFADGSTVKLGKPVFLVGKIFEEGELVAIVNQGIVKALSGDSIRTNIFEKPTLAGSPLFDIEGRVLGLNTIDREGKVITISSSVLREFSGF